MTEQPAPGYEAAASSVSVVVGAEVGKVVVGLQPFKVELFAATTIGRVPVPDSGSRAFVTQVLRPTRPSPHSLPKRLRLLYICNRKRSIRSLQVLRPRVGLCS